MIKLLIVEDEWLVREGLKHTIAWNELDCELVGEAENGVEALEILKKQEVDIVLTDIRMPGMDGLELARHVVENYPEIEIVFLTGFDEFSYAQTALKLGSADYILKPTNPHELTQTFKRVIGKVEQKQEQRQKHEMAQSFLKDHQLRLVSSLFYNLCIGSAGNKELELFQEIRGESRKSLAPYQIVVIELETADEHDEQGRNYLPNDWETDLLHVTQGCMFRLFYHRIVLMLTGNQLQSEWAKEHLMSPLQRQDKKACTICWSDRHDSLHDLPMAYEEALYAVQHVVYLGYPAEIHYSQLNALTGLTDRHSITDQDLEELVKWKNDEDIETSVQEWMVGLLKEYRNEMERRKVTFHFIFDVYMRLYRIMGGNSGIPDHEHLLRKWSQSDSPQAMINWLIEVMVAIRRQYTEQAKTSRHGIQQTMDDLKENYHLDISLQDMARSAHMSESYYSRLFKKHAGISFIEYLTMLRMERAKELLLHPDERIYEVSLAVGYQDSRYFSQLFRKYTGESPTDFRKNRGLTN